jgi:endonuclease/exonuclease/phosphatase family metal-dependent hydrolase
MSVKKKLYLNIVIQTLYWFVLLTALLIIFFTIFPDNDALLTIKYILFSLPRYWFIFLCLLISTQWRYLKTFNKYALPFIIATSFYYLDFQININEKNNQNLNSYTLITANLGEGAELNRLEDLIRFNAPDILVFQEAKNLTGFGAFKDYPFKDCRGHLCFISKYEFKMVNFLEYSMFNGYGYWATIYEVKIKNNKVNIANVHLPTVRKVFSNFSNFDDIHSSRVISASILNQWASLKKNVIIAGDFNMTVTDNLYQRNFTGYQNAITDYGVGFNNTFDYIYRGFSIPGVRVDHILFSGDYIIEQASILASLGGDHRPVLSTFIINNGENNAED